MLESQPSVNVMGLVGLPPLNYGASVILTENCQLLETPKSNTANSVKNIQSQRRGSSNKYKQMLTKKLDSIKESHSFQ